MQKLNIEQLMPICGGLSDMQKHLCCFITGAATVYYYPLPSWYVDLNSSSNDIRLYRYNHEPRKLKDTFKS